MLKRELEDELQFGPSAKQKAKLKIVGALPASFVAQDCLWEGKVPPTNFPPTLLHCQQREQAVDRRRRAHLRMSARFHHSHKS